jgi:hypothetical protein
VIVSEKACRVSCQDRDGVEHAVDVSASSLYEAVARGLRALQANPWVGVIGEGLATISVEVRAGVESKHDVRMQDFRRWLNAPARSPADMTARQRVRDILGDPTTMTDRQLRRRWRKERNQ